MCRCGLGRKGERVEHGDVSIFRHGHVSFNYVRGVFCLSTCVLIGNVGACGEGLETGLTGIASMAGGHIHSRRERHLNHGTERVPDGHIIEILLASDGK